MLSFSFITCQRIKCVYCGDFWGYMKTGRDVCKTTTTGGTIENETSLPLSKLEIKLVRHNKRSV